MGDGGWPTDLWSAFHEKKGLKHLNKKPSNVENRMCKQEAIEGPKKDMNCSCTIL